MKRKWLFSLLAICNDVGSMPAPTFLTYFKLFYYLNFQHTTSKSIKFIFLHFFQCSQIGLSYTKTKCYNSLRCDKTIYKTFPMKRYGLKTHPIKYYVLIVPPRHIKRHYKLSITYIIKCSFPCNFRVI